MGLSYRQGRLLAADSYPPELPEPGEPAPQTEPPTAGRRAWIWMGAGVALLTLALGLTTLLGLWGFSWFEERLRPLEADLGSYQVRLQRLQEEMHTVRGALASVALERIAEQPAPEITAGELDYLERQLPQWRQQGILVGEEHLQTAAARVLPAEAKELPGERAWRTAVQLASYGSFLRFQTSPLAIPKGAVTRTQLATPLSGNAILPGTFTVIERSGTQVLDGFDLGDTVFRQSAVYYGGGPVTLRNVTFEDCTFQVQRTPAGRKLLEALLASNRIPELSLP